MMIPRVSVVVACVFLSTSLSAEAFSGNARVVQAGEHPSVVKVGVGCTGSLISPGVVLTAQHCFPAALSDEQIKNIVKITLPPLPGGKRRAVGISKIVHHEAFHLNGLGDVLKDWNELQTALASLKRDTRPKSNPCKCKQEWSYKDDVYRGCDARAPDSKQTWCFTDGICKGQEWAFCDSNDSNDSKENRFGWKTLFSSRGGAVGRISRTAKLLKKWMQRLVNGQFRSNYVGDVTLVFLDECIVDRTPVQFARNPSEGQTCDIAAGVGYGNLNSGGAWGTRLQGGTGDLGYQDTARIADMRVVSSGTCSYGRTGVGINFMLKKYFSDPKVWYYGLKKLMLRMMLLEWRLLSRRSHNVERGPIVCTTPISEKMQMFNRGDSGGPLFVNGVQIGVASEHGAQGLGAGFLGYYAKVSAYADWISSYIDEDECPLLPIGSPETTRRSLADNVLAFNQLQHDMLLTKNDAWSITETMRQMDQCPVVAQRRQLAIFGDDLTNDEDDWLGDCKAVGIHLLECNPNAMRRIGKALRRRRDEDDDVLGTKDEDDWLGDCKAVGIHLLECNPNAMRRIGKALRRRRDEDDEMLGGGEDDDALGRRNRFPGRRVGQGARDEDYDALGRRNPGGRSRLRRTWRPPRRGFNRNIRI